MKIKILGESNINDYEPLAASDEAENTGRQCYRGYVAYDADDKAVGAMMLLEKGVEESDRENEISFFEATDEVSARALLGRSGVDELSEEKIRVFLEAAELTDDEKNALKSAKFRVSDGESRDLHVAVKELYLAKLPRKKVPPYIRPLKNLDEDEFWAGVTYCMYHEKKGILEDLNTLPKAYFDPDLSCCVCTDYSIEGMLLVHRTPSGRIIPQLFFCGGRDQRKNLFYMMRYAIDTAVSIYPEDTIVILRRHNESSRNLGAYLFPDKKGDRVTIAVRK